MKEIVLTPLNSNSLCFIFVPIDGAGMVGRIAFTWLKGFVFVCGLSLA